jgi:uncharacterized protein YjbI with pentapeptide repeats
MADPEHFDRLRNSAHHDRLRSWNAWRLDHAAIRPDLSGARLAGLTLTDANLRDVNFNGARLIGLIMVRADLSGADLGNTRIIARLEGAVLRGVKLSGATFTATSLDGATLDQADLRGANLYNVDLTQPLSLACKCDHAMEIGESTFKRTAKGLRERPEKREAVHAFLRDCGVPESVIDSFESL